MSTGTYKTSLSGWCCSAHLSQVWWITPWALASPLCSSPTKWHAAPWPGYPSQGLDFASAFPNDWNILPLTWSWLRKLTTAWSPARFGSQADYVCPSVFIILLGLLPTFKSSGISQRNPDLVSSSYMGPWSDTLFIAWSSEAGCSPSSLHHSCPQLARPPLGILSFRLQIELQPP